MHTTYIIGHLKPDLDSVVSAMALEFFFAHTPDFGYPKPKAVIADEINNETHFVLDKFGAITPPVFNPSEVKSEDNFVLVDYNEGTQCHPEINLNQVSEVIDHHKVNFGIDKPIYVTTKPWGSTSTIIWWLAKDNNVTLTQEIAGLMLCAILSDTVGFRSATTTDIDRKAGQFLAEIAQISNMEQLTFEIFQSKSSFDELTAKELVLNDYKVFDFAGKRVLINQIETVEQGKLIEQKSSLMKAMQEVVEENKLDHIFVAISDIINVNTKLLYLGGNDEEILKKGFPDSQASPNIYDIGAKLSRKKEIAPAIENAIIS